MDSILEIKFDMLKKIVSRYAKVNENTYFTPFTMTFLVTKKCDLGCKHCFNFSKNSTFLDDNELSLDEYEKISRSMGFFASALYCGGEPFLRNDFYKIVTMFQNNNHVLWSSATTNGQNNETIYYQTRKIIENDRNKKFVLNFSLEGFKEENDFIRGKGSFDNSIMTFKKLDKLRKEYSNLNLNIVSTLSTLNQKNLDLFFEWISKELSPDAISLLKVRQIPNMGIEIKDVELSAYRRCKNKLIDLFIKNKNGKTDNPISYIPLSFYEYIEKTMKENKRSFHCYAGIHGGYIDYNGTVNVCEVMGDSGCNSFPMQIGNLRNYNYDFRKIWNSKQANEVRSAVNSCDSCLCCTHETEGLLPSIYFEPNIIDINI